MRKAEAFCRHIDMLNEWVVKGLQWVVVAMTILITMDVTLRYAFNKPTLWVWDINIQLLGLISVLGAGYALLHRGHVIMDVLVVHFSRRTEARINLVTSSLFFFTLGIMIWQLGLKAMSSTRLHEAYNSVFAPPLYPLRIAIVIGVILLILQGLAKFIRDLNVALNPGRVEEK